MTDMEARIRLTAKNETGKAFKQFQTDAEKAAKNAKMQFDNLSKGMKVAGVGLTAVGVGAGALITKSTLLAARVQTLGSVLRTVGTNAGYSESALKSYEEGVKDAGITTEVSRQSLIRMIQANLDLEQAVTLARIAQDAAVIAGIDSSQAFNNMIYAIQTLNPRVLKTMGLTVSLEQAYAKHAKTMGITVNEIDMNTKKQIALNEVIAAGEGITDAYTSAMETGGKKLTSLTRLTQEAMLAMGEGMLPIFSDLIDLVTVLLKKFNALSESQKNLVGTTLAATAAFGGMVGPLLFLGTKIPGMIAGMSNFGSAFFSMGTNIAALGTKAGAATTALAGLSPAIGSLAVAGVVALAITAVIAALGSLIKFIADVNREQDNLTQVVKKHEKEVRNTAGSYEEYRTEMERTRKVANSSIWTGRQLIGTQEELDEMLEKGEIFQSQYKKAIVLATEEEQKAAAVKYEAERAQRVLNAETERWIAMGEHYRADIEETAKVLDETLNASLGELQFLMGVDLTQTVEEHRDTMSELQGEYAGLEEKLANLEELYPNLIDQEGTWANQQKTEILGALESTQGKIDEEAAAWERNTNQILFNMAARALEQLPIADQAAALAGLAEEMDLIDPATARAWERVGEFTSLLQEGKIDVDNYAQLITNLKEELEKLPEETNVRVNLRINESGGLTTSGGYTDETFYGPDTTTTDFGSGLSENARGGPLGEGWTLVGEEGQELISPTGWVYDAQTTRKLMEGGLFPEKRRALAGGMAGKGGGGGSTTVVYDQEEDIAQLKTLKDYDSGGGGATTTTTTTMETAAVEAAAEAAVDATSAMAVEITQAVAASVASIGMEMAIVTKQQTDDLRMVMKASQRTAGEQLRVLNEMKGILQKQGTFSQFAGEITEGMSLVDFD
jgi:hypothetical protein